jgi:hypothetical protein
VTRRDLTSPPPNQAFRHIYLHTFKEPRPLDPITNTYRLQLVPPVRPTPVSRWKAREVVISQAPTFEPVHLLPTISIREDSLQYGYSRTGQLWEEQQINLNDLRRR